MKFGQVWTSNIRNMAFYLLVFYSVGYNNMNKLELARFSTSLRIQDRAEFGKGTELQGGGGGGHHAYFHNVGNN